jgi:hypothetical protein
VSGRSGTAPCASGANQSAIRRGRRLPYCLLLISSLVGAAMLQKDGGASFSTVKPQSSAQWAKLYAALPLSFEANRGQTDQEVNFLSRGKGLALFLTRGEAVLTLKNQPSAQNHESSPAPATALRLQLLGANANAVVTGKDELPGKANYFIGNDPSKWRRNIPTYAKVKYESVYPGIDLVYYGNQGGELEYDFVVAQGTDPKAIALGIGGEVQAALQINPQGDLIVPLQGGNVELHKPVVYQPESAEVSSAAGSALTAHHSSMVEGHYALDAQNHVRFELGPYDHTRPLVIDPVLSYATYVGGSGGDIGYGIAVDSSLDAYITGVTNSTNFPTVGTSEQSANAGNGDAFVAKINSQGTRLLYSTYLGGTGSDTATAITVSAGNAFITGYTNSVNFPIAAPVSNASPFQTIYGGNTDAFVVQLDATGSNLVYSSYLGGNGADFGLGIAVDSSGNAYVTGSTLSTNFPVVAALQSFNNGSSDAFVTKVNFNGEQLVYSTFLGGTQADAGQSIQVDSSGNAYVAGYTFSPNFPLVTPLQSVLGGGADAFVAKLNAAGSALTFSTYLGGSGDDRAYGVAIDGSQNVYVTGATVSGNFPTTTGAYQTSLRGSSNAFVSKLNTAGSSLLYSTYLGGSGVDQGNAIAVTSAGVAYVTGFTESTDFPTHNPIQSTLGLSSNTLCGTLPCADVFVTELNAAGNALAYSTYLGGNGPDFGQGIALDNTGDPYITGSTSSTNFPAIAGSYKSTLTGTAGNAFIAKIDPANVATISLVPSTLNFGNETLSVTSPLQQVTVVNPSTVPLTITSIEAGLVGAFSTVFTQTNNCVGTLPAGSSCTINVAFTPATTGQVTDQITITDNTLGVTGNTQTIALSGTGVTAATAVTISPTSLSFSSQNVGTVSPSQNVAITNTGTSTLNISQISTGTGTNDFSQTNTCGLYQYTLSVGQSCTVSVSFSPTASGTRTGSLSITDNATGSPQTVALSGIGAAAFSLSSPSGQNPFIIGSTQTTFVVVANGPTSFNGAITLACSAGSTCSFSPNPIFVGQSSTLTISNLTSSMSNPFPFTVTGTSGTQTASNQFNLLFEDFTLSATPPVRTIEAGTPATYTIIANPLNGFNQQIDLLCSSLGGAPDATCTFSNGTPTLNATSPTSVTLTINTVKYVAPTKAPPHFPNGKLPPVILGLLSLAALASLALSARHRTCQGWLGSGWLKVRLATLCLILVLDLALVACRSSTLLQSGTTTGNYTITISGTLHSNTTVVRTTTLNLAVTSSAP